MKTPSDIFLGKKALLVASTGGHLAQLARFVEANPVHRESLWVTFDSAQSRSLLAGRRMHLVDYVPPRGWREVGRAFKSINQVLSAESFDTVVSTGAGLAVASHLLASLRGIRPTYIESVSRVSGPSLTGRILERVPGVARYAQHEWGASRRGWSNEFSVLDTFSPRQPKPGRSGDRIPRYFVTLGTIRPYQFEALVIAVESALIGRAEVVWQLGATDYRPKFGEINAELSAQDFNNRVEWADTVITHAGVGTLMALIEVGADVIAVPRRAFRGEHVDDHQLQIANEFAERGLVTQAEVDAVPLLLQPGREA